MNWQWVSANKGLVIAIAVIVVGGVALISGVITLEDFKELLGRTQIEGN